MAKDDVTHLDSSVLKRRADGAQVLSNYLEGSEDIVNPDGDTVKGAKKAAKERVSDTKSSSGSKSSGANKTTGGGKSVAGARSSARKR